MRQNNHPTNLHGGHVQVNAATGSQPGQALPMGATTPPVAVLTLEMPRGARPGDEITVMTDVGRFAIIVPLQNAAASAHETQRRLEVQFPPFPESSTRSEIQVLQVLHDGREADVQGVPCVVQLHAPPPLLVVQQEHGTAVSSPREGAAVRATPTPSLMRPGVPCHTTIHHDRCA